ncbi:hypothetical protein BDY24DRAFT_412485 [Mrakia frigida]|uniref:uncharacterized protein n=1 Tax=Mrakia frigida TaxID=29902 RepID=UPI003FCC0856
MTWLWSDFTPLERKNIGIYIVGIMLYKLGLESFNGSIITLATDRFTASNTFGKLGALTGLNQAMQASLARMESQDREVSALGSVMAFLFSSYIILYAILGSVLGSYIDKVYNRDGNIYDALVYVGGFTVLCVIILAATLVPKGAFAFNPHLINNAELEGEIETDDENGVQKDHQRPSDEDEKYEKPTKTTDVGAML